MGETRFQYLKISFAVCPTQNFQAISGYGQRSKDCLAMVKPDTPPTGDNALDIDEKGTDILYSTLDRTVIPAAASSYQSNPVPPSRERHL
jgi:hypothetical protein